MHIYCPGLLGHRPHSVVMILLLGRWWKGHSSLTLGKILLWTFIVQVCKRLSLLSTCDSFTWKMVLKGHLWVLQGKILLSTFIVQFFWEKEHLEWACTSWKDWFFWKFPFWEGVVVLKGLIYSYDFLLGNCGGLENIDFGQFTLGGCHELKGNGFGFSL